MQGAMSMGVHSVVIPLTLTIWIWAAAFFWPVKNTGGPYNWGPAWEVLLHLVLGVVATLIVWLVYVTALLIF